MIINLSCFSLKYVVFHTFIFSIFHSFLLCFNLCSRILVGYGSPASGLLWGVYRFYNYTFYTIASLHSPLSLFLWPLFSSLNNQFRCIYFFRPPSVHLILPGLLHILYGSPPDMPLSIFLYRCARSTFLAKILNIFGKIFWENRSLK